MTPAQDALALTRIAVWQHAMLKETGCGGAYIQPCVRGALRIIIAHGSRKVREEAKELLKKVTYD